MTWLRNTLIALGLVAAAPALAQGPTPADLDTRVQASLRPDVQNVLIVSDTGKGYATNDNKIIEHGEDPILHAVALITGPDGDLYLSDTDSLKIDGEAIPQDRIFPFPDNFSAAWFRVESDSRGKWYNNSSRDWMWDHWEPLDYAETPLGKGLSIKADVAPTILDPIYQDGEAVGTMRFSLVLCDGETFYETPGSNSRHQGGVSEDVHRIAKKGDTGNDIIDNAYALCNNPYIWASNTTTGSEFDNQAEHFVGADCADFAVAASRLAGFEGLPYAGSMTLDGYTDFVVRPRSSGNIEGTFVDEEGNSIPIGEDGVKIGDFVLYHRHAALLAEDRSDPYGILDGRPNGVLDEHDLVIHTLFAEPRLQPITDYNPKFTIRRQRKDQRAAQEGDVFDLAGHIDAILTYSNGMARSSELAARMGLTEITDANNLEIGDKIFIPPNYSPDKFTWVVYTVKEGDSMTEIARRAVKGTLVDYKPNE
ncbi:MAG: hypothetical protein ABIA62_00005 [Candidatus Woesearchaeota archaeon]